MLFKLLKFFLNVIEPETAHKFAIKFIKSPLLKSKNFENNSYENLNQRIFGLNFKNPVGLAAGFDKNAAINLQNKVRPELIEFMKPLEK